MTYLLLIVAMSALAHYVHGRSYHRGVAAGMEAALVDAATRLPTEAVVMQIFAMEFAAAERGRPLTIVMSSIDNFGRLAPLNGGEIGQRIMLGAGAILRRRTRGMHVSSRQGDNGVFLSVLGGSRPEGAATFASRVRKDLLSLPSGPQALSVTSVICGYRPGMHSIAEMLSMADESLWEAKQRGGNQIVISGERELEPGSGFAFIS